MFGTKAKNAIVTLEPRTVDKEPPQKSLTEPLPAPQPAPTQQRGQPPRPSTLAHPSSRRIFKIEKPRKTYLVSAEKGPPLHLIDIRTEVRRSSDLLFHETADASSPVVLLADLGQGKTRPYRVGLAGAPSKGSAADTSWLEMKRESWNMTKHTWAFPPPWLPSSAAAATAPAGNSTTPRSLSWTRTRSQAVDGYKIPRWNSRCLKLVDEASGDVLALFTRVTASGQCGMLQVNVNWGREFDWLVFLTALLIEEKIGRQEMEAVIGDSGERR